MPDTLERFGTFLYGTDWFPPVFVSDSDGSPAHILILRRERTENAGGKPLFGLPTSFCRSWDGTALPGSVPSVWVIELEVVVIAN